MIANCVLKSNSKIVVVTVAVVITVVVVVVADAGFGRRFLQSPFNRRVVAMKSPKRQRRPSAKDAQACVKNIIMSMNKDLS